MNWYEIVILIILLLYFSVFMFNINLEYNILDNIGKISIKLFNFIPIFVANISFAGLCINCAIKNKKVVNIKIDLNDKNLQFINELQKQLLKKIFVIKFFVGFNLSIENAQNCVLFGSFLNILINNFISNIKSSKPSAKVKNISNIGFLENKFIINVQTNFVIKLVDIFPAFLKAIISRRKYEKREIESAETIR